MFRTVVAAGYQPMVTNTSQNYMEFCRVGPKSYLSIIKTSLKTQATMSAHLATMSMGRKRWEVSASRDPSSDVPELPLGY